MNPFHRESRHSWKPHHTYNLYKHPEIVTGVSWEDAVSHPGMLFSGIFEALSHLFPGVDFSTTYRLDRCEPCRDGCCFGVVVARLQVRTLLGWSAVLEQGLVGWQV